MVFNKYLIMVCLSLISLLNIIILDIIEYRMCKQLTLYRIFTINSTVCNNISIAVSVNEKCFVTLIISLGSTVFQQILTYYSPLDNTLTLG